MSNLLWGGVCRHCCTDEKLTPEFVRTIPYGLKTAAFQWETQKAGESNE